MLFGNSITPVNVNETVFDISLHLWYFSPLTLITLLVVLPGHLIIFPLVFLHWPFPVLLSPFLSILNVVTPSPCLLALHNLFLPVCCCSSSRVGKLGNLTPVFLHKISPHYRFIFIPAFNIVTQCPYLPAPFPTSFSLPFAVATPFILTSHVVKHFFLSPPSSPPPLSSTSSLSSSPSFQNLAPTHFPQSFFSLYSFLSFLSIPFSLCLFLFPLNAL